MPNLFRRALAVLLLAFTVHCATAQVASNSVLIVYDGAGDFGWYGNLHAKLLANLMGHFNLTPVLEPVESYTAGQANQYRAVFYLGMVFDNPLPAAFTNDISTTTNSVCWIKNNLWRVSGNVFFPKPIDARIGFRVVTLDGLNPDFTINTNLDTAIAYKGELLSKNKLDPVLGLVEIVNTNLVAIPALAWRTNNTTTNTYSVPYIAHGDNFWYVSDSPFDYMSEEDRYLVFADLLHDILKINHAESHTAIIRLEDVAPEVYSAGQLTAATDYLKSNSVPFAMAVIPHYTDPQGYYNSGIPLEHIISDTNDAVARVMLGEFRHAGTNGGQFIMHGYTHQYDVVANPSTGVSADDFEFWRESFFTNSTDFENYQPVAEDSYAWVSNRLALGLQQMTVAGIPPVAWEPPHYAASELDYRIFATNFNLTMMRALYFADDYTPANRHIAGQFFPYPIAQDVHGNRIVGENLGNYEPNPLPPATGRSSLQIVNAAKKNLVIRDGTANAFFHGFYEHTNLYTIIQGIKALGYTYVQLVPTGAPKIIQSPVGVTNQSVGANFYLGVAAVGAATLNYQWNFNGSPLANATNAVLDFTAAQTNQAGNYFCTVSNNFGSVTSAVVSVDIGQVPAFTTQPLAQTNVLGLPVNFTSAVSGTGPFGYQWRLNGVTLVGETNATLALAATTLAMTNGQFSVVATNRYGAATSSNALLTLRLPPVVLTPPQSQLIVVSNAVTFSVTNLGDLPLKYQWKFNTNTSIVNATNSSFALTSVKIANGGTFSVVLSNFYGIVTSAPALLTVVTAPVFTNQPASQSVFAGSNATFTAGWLGSPVVSLQWQFNNANVVGATNSALTITNVQLANLGNYALIAANNFSSTTSAVAVLTVNQPPTITNQPVGLQVSGGSNATFTVGVTGTAPFAFQWRLNGTNVANANTNFLALTNVVTTNAGNYDVVITNFFGSVTSSVAALVVGFPPIITTNPAPLTLLQGASSNFTVAAIGDSPLAFQWRFNGTNILSATNPSLAFPNVTAASAGNYDAIVSNPYGAVTSTVAALVVNVPATIVTNPASQTILASSNVTFAVAASGTPTLTYQWRFNSANLGGANLNTLSLTNVLTNNAGAYDVVVANAFGSVTSAPAALAVVFAPNILTNPAPLTVAAGSNATFAVVASGDAPLAFQWRFNSTNILSATNTLLTVSNAVGTNAGNYDVVVTNNYGAVTSTVAALTVNVPVTITTNPVAQTNSVGSNVTFSVGVSGSAPFAYQWRFNATNLLANATNSSLSLTNVQFTNGGNYSVLVTNNFGAVTSAIAALTVLSPPIITVQPVTVTNLVGTTATVFVTAIGSPTVRYQWYRNGNLVTNGVGNSIVLNNVIPASGANFFCIITNNYGIVTSSTAAIVIVSPPAVTNQPVSRTNVAGSTASFSVTVTGTAPFTYQWRFNGTNLAGANTNSLSLTNVQFTNGGNYDVVVSNAYAGTTSAVAVLTVSAAPTIVTSPAAQNIGVNSNATFTVGVNGTAPLAFQWRFNGAPISGATTNPFTLPGVFTNNAGSYDVIVTNSFGSVTSAPAALTVSFPPSITNQRAPVAVVVSNNAAFAVGVDGTAPFTYQWRVNGTNILNANTNTLALTNVLGSDAANYDVVVQNPFGVVTSIVAALTVNFPPTITNQPASLAALATSNATFAVGVSGTATLAYQWRFNGAAIFGANNSALTVSNVSALNVGNYDVIVTNNFGALTSSVAALTVNFPPTITNQPASLAVLATSNAVFAVGVSGTAPFSYLWRLNGTNLAATASTLALTNTSAADAGNYDVIVQNAFGSVTSVVVTLTVNFPPAITAQPVSQAALATSNATFTVTATGTATLAYQWRFNGAGISGANNSSLTVSNVNQTNVGNYDVIVTNNFGALTSSVAALTVNFPPTITNQPVAQSVVVSNAATFSVLSSGSEPQNYQWWLNITNLVAGGTNSTLVIPSARAADAGDYSVVVSNPYGSATSAPAALTVHFPARITASPASLAVVATSNGTFTVTADGDAPLAYQWNFNGTNISGANASTLTVSNVALAGQGNYFVTVSNAYGSATSAVATLTVNFIPVITNQPASVTVATGSNVNLGVGVTGSAPFSYQWFRSGTNAVADATNAALNFASAQTNDTGSYYVVINNSYGATTSSVATLTVYQPISISSSPASQTNLVGSNVTFSVGVTGTAPFVYQWRFNTTNILAATNSSFTVNNAQFTNAGNYDVIAANPFGATNSIAATLTVVAPPAITVPPLSRTNLVGSVANFNVTASGTGPLAYQWYRNGSVITNANGNQITLSNVIAASAANFFVVLTNNYGAVTSATVALTIVSPPTITNQPASRTNNLGTAATFSVVVTGTAPFAYQWRFNGTNLLGANTNSLSLANVQATNAGNYDVVVTNAYAAVTSSVATLTVNVAPTITTPPASRTNTLGSTATFTVVATGAPAPAYVWKFNTVTIPGATNATLTLTNVAATNAGNYTVLVANLLGSTLSSIATLTVNSVAPPLLTLTPGVGNTVTLTFNSTASQSYTVEYLNSLGNTNWLALTNVLGTGAPLTVPLAMPTPARFFRVRTP